jgi:hyperosmotically inducible protein
MAGLGAILGIGLMAQPAMAQLGNILTAPKTLVDRMIEARSAEDIAKDNDIVLKVNGVMADLGTIKASTRIYEQRLLITGLFDDRRTYDRFEKDVRAIKGVKKLYWHVAFMTPADKAKNEKKMIDWPDALAMETKAEARLIGTAGVADVNFRVASDAFATVYLLGRARSQEERTKAVARVRDGEGVKKVVDYVEVRP